MSAPIEALSISSLTNLLSNPPQYPRNPTHQPHDALVLYIVRVPGSKDVFLTPLKPPTKASISLELVRTSLYYLHVETPEDEILRKSLEAERLADKPPQPPILRKPLPPTPFANYPSSQRPPTPPKSYPHYQPPGFGHEGDTQTERYISRGSHVRLSSPHKPSSRHALGARPLPSEEVSKENSPISSPHTHQTPENEDSSRRWSVPDRQPAPWTPRLQVPETTSVPFEPRTSDDVDGKPGDRSHRETSPVGFTNITLIRRDPTSGTQWNVGAINVESRPHSLALLHPVEIHLTSPGYTRFSRIPDPSPAASSPTSISPSSASSTNDVFFRRRVAFRPLPDQHRPSLQQVRANSGDFLSDLTRTPAKKIRQVYAYTSPWQGLCTFNNGVDGRSLRCRHSLPAHSSTEPESGVSAAELRFNLPWSVLRSKDANRQPLLEADKLPIAQLLAKSKSPKDQWRRSVQSFKPQHRSGRPHSVTISEGQPPAIPARDQDGEDTSRISLKLGREKAGGGFKGHSAKLGKLILEDEGLKMCDLTVAACMGVWWQHYMESA